MMRRLLALGLALLTVAIPAQGTNDSIGKHPVYKDFSGKPVVAAGPPKHGILGPRARLTDAPGGRGLAGGPGDDQYVVTDPATRIVEASSAGTDTVASYTDFVLPPHVEILELLGNLTSGIASGRDNLITTTGQRNNLIGGTGDDVLADESSSKINIFVIGPGSGRDVIYGFTPSGPGHDLLRFDRPELTSFAAVRRIMTQVGSDVLLTFDATNRLLVRDIALADLGEANFLLPHVAGARTPTFAEEFDALSLWNRTTGKGRWKTNLTSGAQDGYGSFDSRTLQPNQEAQVYVDAVWHGDPRFSDRPLGLDPFSVAGGILSITARPVAPALQQKLWNYKYSSGLLTTEKSFAQTYGYFEMRAEVPMTKGSFPAFWLLPTSRTWPPEIDIMENVGRNFISGGAIAADSKNAFYTYFPAGITGMHVYGLRWTPARITWYVDGNAVGSIATPASMHQPMYLLVNLAIGGGWAGLPAPDFSAAVMKIDYIRAYPLEP